MITPLDLVALADRYAAARGLSRSRISTIVFNDGKVLDRLATGADITLTRCATSVAWFSDNWPPGIDWPDGIDRPAVAAARQEPTPALANEG